MADVETVARGVGPSVEGPSQPERADVFLSYAREDRVFAQTLAAALRGHEKDVWLA
jgi:hypothetical protein